MEMMLNKKRFRAIFLLKFKIGHKAAETTHNIKNTFGPGTANKGAIQWWFKKFCKGNESLEDEKHSGWPWEVDNDQLRAVIEADPLTTTREVAQELNHSMVIRHLKQIGKMHSEVSSLILHNNEPFLNWIMTCDKKWIVYDNP
uniref:Mos1 transposase HTH domain-containing protein n=1 Tax=Bos indicus x Bos taurus TaxID=30522 RepID=A0A4W2ICD1_BOBOX